RTTRGRAPARPESASGSRASPAGERSCVHSTPQVQRLGAPSGWALPVIGCWLSVIGVSAVPPATENQQPTTRWNLMSVDVLMRVIAVFDHGRVDIGLVDADGGDEDGRH